MLRHRAVAEVGLGDLGQGPGAQVGLEHGLGLLLEDLLLQVHEQVAHEIVAQRDDDPEHQGLGQDPANGGVAPPDHGRGGGRLGGLAGQNVTRHGQGLLSVSRSGREGWSKAGEAARLEGDARRCFARARAFVPGLSEQDVLPAWRGQHEPEDPPGTDSTGAVRDVLLAGWRNLRRLPVEVFPGLPETVAGTLKRMGCRIPQPDERPHLPGPHNLIRGRFIDPGKESWAALCCVQGTARLLVFRDAEDTQPETLGGGLELWWMPSSGPSSAEFSWLITVAEARLNRRYHEPCGGVPLPPLDHDGIELHFLGKASVILSWHTGRWLSLQGAD